MVDATALAQRHMAGWLLSALAIPADSAQTVSHSSLTMWAAHVSAGCMKMGALLTNAAGAGSCLPSAQTHPRQAVCAGTLLRLSPTSACSCASVLMPSRALQLQENQMAQRNPDWMLHRAAARPHLLLTTMAQGKHGAHKVSMLWPHSHLIPCAWCRLWVPSWQCRRAPPSRRGVAPQQASPRCCTGRAPREQAACRRSGGARHDVQRSAISVPLARQLKCGPVVLQPCI